MDPLRLSNPGYRDARIITTAALKPGGVVLRRCRTCQAGSIGVPASVLLASYDERREPHRAWSVVRFVPHRTLRPCSDSRPGP